tara:strand:+ start:78 stop:1952 length:1875 start_codon:yes stop_codon:yes gene_type:complete
MKKSALLSLFAGLSTIASASDSKIDEVMVVTANRIETPISKVLSPVSVITAADIERLQITQMTDLLSRMTSVESLSSGGPGSTNGIFVRGGNTDHTLVLVDGVRMSSATNGSTSVELIDLSNVESIELVRGPASSLYGADALSGVLQIITKDSQEEKLSIRADYGSQDWAKTSVRGSGGNDTTTWSLGLSHETFNDFDRREIDGFSNGDDDNYRNSQLSASLRHQWSESVQTKVSYQLNKGESERDNACKNSSYAEVNCLPYSDHRQELLNIESYWQFDDSLSLKAQIARSVDVTENGDDVALASEVSGTDSYFKTTKDTYLLQANYELSNEVQAIVGAEYYNDRVKSSSDFLATSRENMAWFSQLVFSFGKVDAQLGFRNDDNEAFGTHNTQSVAVGYQLSDSSKLIASWGTAFRAPTFNDLYWPEDPFGIGNLELTPEESENMELAYKFRHQGHSLSAAIFKNRIDGLIDWAPVDPNNFFGQWTPSNLADVRIKGFEFEYGYVTGALSANVNYSWTDADDLANDDRLKNRARRIFNADLSYALSSSISVGASMKARSERFTNNRHNPELPGFGVVDLRSSYQASESVLVDASVTNVFDKEYVEREGFNEQGIGFKVGVTYRM